MAKSKKNKNKNKGSSSAASGSGVSASENVSNSNNNNKNNNNSNNSNNNNQASSRSHPLRENLDDLAWLRECELRQCSTGEPYLQLEYQDDDELILILQRFLEESTATAEIVDMVYQIWQQTVLSTLLQSCAVWKKDNVTPADQRQMKDTLKTARYKINFIMHHVTGSMLTNPQLKWQHLRPNLLDMCYNTLQLVPRLAESCPHHKTDIRLCIIHFEGKEFLAAVACETWDTLYDYSIQIDPVKFIPILRRCAMFDVLDKDWNMLGGWEDILKGIEAKCCAGITIARLPSDQVLHETTTILRNARNSMQCKFFSVRFMRYTEDQAPQRWRYFPKCSAPTCSNIETPMQPHIHRCRKCWYFHYCSPACQEYCDNIMGLHPKFCKDTPTSKAALCQRETEQYLGWNLGGNSGSGTGSEDDDSTDVLTCQACGAMEEFRHNATGTKLDHNGGATSTMKRCQRCQAVCYCSRRCQEWDWRIGGHRETCKPVPQQQKQQQQQHHSPHPITNHTSNSGVDDVVNMKDLN